MKSMTARSPSNLIPNKERIRTSKCHSIELTGHDIALEHLSGKGIDEHSEGIFWS